MLLAGAATAITLLPLCDAVFDCGCTWPFLGAAAHCNVHNPAPPHCPLCTNWGAGAAFAAVLFAGWGVVVTALGRAIKGGARDRPVDRLDG